MINIAESLYRAVEFWTLHALQRLVDSMKFGLRTTMQSQTDTIKVYPHDSFIADPQHKYAES